MTLRPYRTALALTVAALVTAPALAQVTPKPDGRMRAVLGLGASLASGNTSARNLSLVADAVRMTEQDKLSLYANAQYARTNGVTGTELLRGGGRYDWNLGPSYFAFGGLDLERNKPANLSLRAALGGGLGWHVVRNDTTNFDVYGGLVYNRDAYVTPTLVAGQVRDAYAYPALLLGEESTHKLSDTTSFKQRLVVKPNLRNSGQFLANFDAGIAVAMTKSLNLTVGLSAIHNSDPGPGRAKTDTLLSTGISMSFE